MSDNVGVTAQIGLSKQDILTRQPYAHMKNRDSMVKPTAKKPLLNASNPVKGQWRVNDAWRCNPVLGRALPQLEQNVRLTADLVALMPDTLKVGWKAYLSERTLTLKVPHNAIAVKIKQLKPLLLSGLQMTQWPIDDMVVKVSHFNQPVWLKTQKDAQQQEKPITHRILTPLSADRIHETVGRLPEDSPLSEALTRLLKNHHR